MQEWSSPGQNPKIENNIKEHQTWFQDNHIVNPERSVEAIRALGDWDTVLAKMSDDDIIDMLTTPEAQALMTMTGPMTRESLVNAYSDKPEELREVVNTAFTAVLYSESFRIRELQVFKTFTPISETFSAIDSMTDAEVEQVRACAVLFCLCGRALANEM